MPIFTKGILLARDKNLVSDTELETIFIAHEPLCSIYRDTRLACDCHPDVTFMANDKLMKIHPNGSITDALRDPTYLQSVQRGLKDSAEGI